MIMLDPKLIEPIILACLEKDSVDLRKVDEQEVQRARNAIKRAHDPKGAGLRDIITRKEFLAACLDHTGSAQREHLIVGYGYQYRNSTDIHRIHHVGGEERRVHIPDYVRNEIRRHHFHQTDAEVVVFHNHPRTGEEPEWFYTLKALVHDLPIASIDDRRALQEHAFNPVGLLRQLFGQGQVRFYLGESNYVREFRLPPLLQFLEGIKTAGQS